MDPFDNTTTAADTLAHQVAAGLRSHEGTAPAWGLELLDARQGYARVAMTATGAMLNGYGSVHGGMIFGLADTAFAYACNSRNVATVAQQASICFLAAAQLGDRLVAEAREQALAGRSGSYAVTISVQDRIIATFHGLSRSLGRPCFEFDTSEQQ